MYVVSWIGYRTGQPCKTEVYGEHHAESYAAALRRNGVEGVTVTGPFPYERATGVVVAARWYQGK
jgi:hypothetical protein